MGGKIDYKVSRKPVASGYWNSVGPVYPVLSFPFLHWYSYSSVHPGYFLALKVLLNREQTCFSLRFFQPDLRQEKYRHRVSHS